MTAPRTYFLTTPIYYVNDVPHVGHAYTTIAADALTRSRRLQGKDAFLLTGTDEHGQNIERIAREKGVPAQQYCDQISAVFKALWDRLDIRYDGFIRTTEDRHVRGVLKLWDRLIKAKCPDGRDAIYAGTYAGWYCPRCEEFKDEEELKQPGNLCPIHERPSEWTEEENYFFRLSAYEGWLRDAIVGGRLRIDPEARRNEVLGIIGSGLKDFSVSRARVKWGIPVPQRPEHVFYVWVDALSNYITALDYAGDGPLYRKYWDGDSAERCHLIGKDILRFHCLYWPALLEAAGVKPPNRAYVQGWITKEGKKLSKTTGNVIDPQALVDQYGPDPVRYFLLREGSYGQDWDFTDQAFVGRYNSDLANDLGNLVSRALTMVDRYRQGKVPPKGTRVDSHRRLRRPGQLRAARLRGRSRADLGGRVQAQPAHRRERPVGDGQGPEQIWRPRLPALRPPGRGPLDRHPGAPGHASRRRPHLHDARPRRARPRARGPRLGPAGAGLAAPRRGAAVSPASKRRGPCPTASRPRRLRPRRRRRPRRRPWPRSWTSPTSPRWSCAWAASSPRRRCRARRSS
jgi:methionyl-tRNA synthetase